MPAVALQAKLSVLHSGASLEVGETCEYLGWLKTILDHLEWHIKASKAHGCWNQSHLGWTHSPSRMVT